MEQERTEGAVETVSWPGEARATSHADRIRAVLAGMPRPQSRSVALAAMEPAAPVQVLEAPRLDAPTPHLDVEPASPSVAPTGPEPLDSEPLFDPAPSVDPSPFVDPHLVAPPPPLSYQAVFEDPAPPRSRHRLRRVLVVLVVLALVAAATGGTYYWRHRTKSVSWDTRVLPIVHFVEHARGLDFKQPVPVQFLSSSQFEKVVSVPQPTTHHDRAAMTSAVRELRALGLVSGNVNLAASLDTLSKAGVVGLYIPDKKTVYVRGSVMTPFVRVTLAHELTHALQDQYYGLDRLQSMQSADGLAVTALIEGDATRVENAYRQTLSSADETSYEHALQAAEQRAGAAGVPAVLEDVAGFPYSFGTTYVDALAANGGVAAVNAAFRSPPRSQAQILDPDLYPTGWRPLPVARPALPAGARTLDTASPFGQAMLFDVLGTRLGYGQAWSAVQGWQGDNSVPFSQAGKTCVAIDVRMDTAAQATALAAAETAWAAASGIPGATATQRGTLVSLVSCDPGAAATALPTSSPSAFDVLSARAAFIGGIITSGPADFPLGRCVADSVIGQVGPAGYGELTAATLSQAQEQSLLQMAAAAARQCEAAGVR